MTSTTISGIPDQYQALVESYVSILEKTNQQLGMWTNPYGIAVGVLAILIGFIAIAVSIVLWKNSRDQKESAISFFKNQQKIIDEKNKLMQKAETKLSELIEAYQKELKAVGADKKRIQENIDDLKKEKATIQNQFLAATPVENPFVISSPFTSVLSSSGSAFFGPQKRSMICARCGKSFEYYEDGDWRPANSAYNSISLLGGTLSGKKIFCTHCGEVNVPQ